MFCLRDGRGATRNSNRVLRRVGPGERRNIGVLYEVLMSALFIIGMAESLLNRTVVKENKTEVPLVLNTVEQSY